MSCGKKKCRIRHLPDSYQRSIHHSVQFKTIIQRTGVVCTEETFSSLQAELGKQEKQRTEEKQSQRCNYREKTRLWFFAHRKSVMKLVTERVYMSGNVTCSHSALKQVGLWVSVAARCVYTALIRYHLSQTQSCCRCQENKLQPPRHQRPFSYSVFRNRKSFHELFTNRCFLYSARQQINTDVKISLNIYSF